MIDFGLPKVWMCDECPIVCDFERRFQYAHEDDIFEYFGLFDHCGCEKIDGELWMWHGCEDAWGDIPTNCPKGKRKTGRAYRREMRVKKFEEKKNIVLAQRNSGTLSVGMDKANMPAARPYQLWRFGMDEDGVRLTYIKRTKKSDHKKSLERYANKLFRRTDFIGKEKSYHKKVYNVKYELYLELW